MSAVATGLTSPTAVVTVFRPGTTRTVGVYELEDVTVSGVHQAGTKANAETVSLKFGKVTFTAGGASMCFDLLANISC